MIGVVVLESDDLFSFCDGCVYYSSMRIEDSKSIPTRWDRTYFSKAQEPDLPVSGTGIDSQKIYCVELDKTFDSLEEAADSVQCEYKEAIAHACLTHTMAFGMHWLWD